MEWHDRVMTAPLIKPAASPKVVLDGILSFRHSELSFRPHRLGRGPRRFPFTAHVELRVTVSSGGLHDDMQIQDDPPSPSPLMI